MPEILKVENVSKKFSVSQNKVLTILDKISFNVQQGEVVSVIGPSGSGKTTLLGLAAGLDLPTDGQIIFDGIDITRLNEDDRAFLRNRNTGFVFQNFQLLPTLTALENVMLPLELRGEKKVAGSAKDLLQRVGLSDRFHHFPNQLSGGEQQRVAMARAFIGVPKLLFADEPTGNLDEDTASGITELLFEINREMQTTLVLVTHNQTLAARTNRILQLQRGKLVEDIQTAEK